MFIVAALTSPTLGNAIDGHFLHWLAVQLVLQQKINWSDPSTVLRNELTARNRTDFPCCL